MFKGCFEFSATIVGNSVSFPRGTIASTDPAVDRIEIESDGKEIRSTVFLKSASTKEHGLELAAKANANVLNRLGYIYLVAIENARCTASASDPQTTPGVLNAEVGHYFVFGQSATFVRGIQVASVVMELENAMPGERHFGLLRSALQSISPVDKFMHLYHILLMLCGDKQKAVEEFIDKNSVEPPPMTPDPRDASKMETVYTRLRNEFAHPTRGVPVEDIKKGMADWVGTLAQLTKQAIAIRDRRHD
jgi:hypothetical protein